jgi:hypothetical protein
VPSNECRAARSQLDVEAEVVVDDGEVDGATVLRVD